ncbi:MAG: thioesterase family protein [Kiritimatiellae bacterium]|mgnify:FL=1|jgi:acyl-CoA thioester hydrolase|nr:thioesterase family protein [Kiritimatiellia bacterium]MDD3441404.1 thioesterase family protein [Kiritimatiellia bacterium]MDD4118573.1 thioesterase family protein [Kiritimatiellia bacterium]NCC92152.1 acyl-CoA thioesterase [Opitutae bacterium]
MFSKTVTPRFGDVDGLRHINNTRLPLWFELGREPLFRLFNPGMQLDNWNLIMAHIDVDFIVPMGLGADIEIRTAVAKIGTTSFTVSQEAWQNGEMGARGSAVVVHYDFRNRRPLPIPEDIRTKLKEHLA